MNNENYITVKQAAELAGVHLQTVYSWIYDGKIKSEKHPLTKKVRISKEEFEKIINVWEVMDAV